MCCWLLFFLPFIGCCGGRREFGPGCDFHIRRNDPRICGVRSSTSQDLQNIPMRRYRNEDMRCHTR